MTMKGNIYSRQKCPVCGSRFVYQERRNGLFCLEHKDIAATKQFYLKFGKEIFLSFTNFPQAERCLSGLRYKYDEGTLDPKDFKKDNPLGFKNLIMKWRNIKKKKIATGSYKNIRSYTNKAIDKFDNRNIKTIGYGDLEEFFLDHAHLASKTIHDMSRWLQQFFKWVEKNESHFKSPEFPETKYTLGWRNLVEKKDQTAILAEIKRISYDYNPKIWLGIRWLSIYVKMRPKEMLAIKEKHINVNGCLVIPPEETKERKAPKFIPLLDEDIEFINNLPKGFPEQHFFRHEKNTRGVAAGKKFGKSYLYDWWMKACKNLGIEGVDLYGGTKHSTVTALAEHFSEKEIMQHGTGHDTSKAFRRYMQADSHQSRMIYQKAAGKEPAPPLHHIIHVDFKKKASDNK